MRIQKGSWFALISFCGLMSLAASLSFALVLAGGAMAFASPGDEQPQKTDSAAEQTFLGMITDSQCGARHSRYSDKRPADCARMCVRNGSSYLLINGDQKNILQGSQPALDHLAGQRATVKGTLNGDTIKVSSAVALEQ